ncbi:MAG: patatin-like phospholipase family protein [Ruminiclostridium sp.]|nr:patatin-like phospholipase family protein [Ruminiclostridium sp.]
MKTGIIFEGGASRTAYSCGVMDCLLDNEIYIDYVLGVSAGIAYGVSYSSRQKGRNYAIFEKFVEY